MTLPLRILLPGVLLACSLLSACGAPSDPTPAGGVPEPAAVDPAELEAAAEAIRVELRAMGRPEVVG